MKIGILTHHYINNFGAFLQAYALQEAIKDLFPEDEVRIIDEVNLKHFIINTGGWFRFYKQRENFLNWRRKICLPYTFHCARKKYMSLSKRCYTTNAVERLAFDYIIVGSDEVWNYRENKGNARIKFGDGLSCSKLIAYAPSVGNTFNKQIPDYAVHGIRRFHAVSARDNLTQQLIRQIRGEEAQRVLDPTFLVKLPEEPVSNINEPYLLFYYCEGLPPDEKKALFEYARNRGMKLYGAGECDKDYSSITVNLTPFQWVWMFRHASCVVTGTFHGVVFSLLNHKKFACYLTNPSRIQKVSSLLEEFGLKNRQVIGKAESIIQILESDVDYDKFEKLANRKRMESRSFLVTAIEEQNRRCYEAL